MKNHIPVMEALIMAGADKDRRGSSEYRETAFIDARYHVSPEAAVRLVQLGADHTLTAGNLWNRGLNRVGARIAQGWTSKMDAQVEKAIEATTMQSILSSYPPERMSAEIKFQARQQRDRGLRDQRLVKGTRIEILKGTQRQRGTYEGWKRSKAGSNIHLIRFETSAMKAKEVKLKNLKPTEWRIIPGIRDTSEAETEALAEECNRSAAETLSKALSEPDTRPTVRHTLEGDQEAQDDISAWLNLRLGYNRQAKWKPDGKGLMISYTQRNQAAKLLASELCTSLQNRGHPVWLDVRRKDKGEAAMKEAAQKSRCVIAIVTGVEREGDSEEDTAYFKREFCLKELRWAREVEVPIQPVIAAEDKQKVGEFIGQAPQDLKDLGQVDFSHLDRSDLRIWDTAVEIMLKNIEALADGGPPQVHGDATVSEPASSTAPPEPEPEPEPELPPDDFRVGSDALVNCIPSQDHSSDAIDGGEPDVRLGESAFSSGPEGSDAGSTPSSAPSDVDELDEWLAQIGLAYCAARIKEYGYDRMKALLVAKEQDIVAMSEDAGVKMKPPHKPMLVAEWKELVATRTRATLTLPSVCHLQPAGRGHSIAAHTSD